MKNTLQPDDYEEMADAVNTAFLPTPVLVGEHGPELVVPGGLTTFPSNGTNPVPINGRVLFPTGGGHSHYTGTYTVTLT